VIYCEWYNSVLQNPQGKMVSVMSQVLDITERKRAEEALRESENRLRTIVEGTQALLMSVDTNGHFTYANEATARAVGYTSPAELIGKAYLHFIHIEDRQQVLDTFINQANPRQPSSLQEFRIVDTAGKVKWFSFLASLEIKAGQVVGRSGVALDITERKRAEEALRKKDEHYRNVIESIFRFVPEGLLVLSEDFNPLKQNKAFGELVQQYAAQLGYTEQELAELITEQVRRKILSEDTTEIQIPKKRL